MNRLTTRNSMGVAALKIPYQCERCGEETYRLADYGNGEPIEKLAEYEDLEEQGKLLKLPCAVGDTVYAIEVDEENFTHFHCPRKISEYKFNLQMLYLLGMFGKCIFLTREEAEAALKKLEG